MNKKESRETYYKFMSPEELAAYTLEVGMLLKSINEYAVIRVIGGGAMVLGYGVDRPTEDIDAQFLEGNKEAFEEAVKYVQQKYGLGKKWINFPASSFLSLEPDPGEGYRDFANLKIIYVSLEHLLAMKLRAFREKDRQDMARLVTWLGLKDPRQVSDIHDKFFDDSYMEYVGGDEMYFRACELFKWMKYNRMM